MNGHIEVKKQKINVSSYQQSDNVIWPRKDIRLLPSQALAHPSSETLGQLDGSKGFS